MATTMKDVARQAGVDISTVSLAINNDPRIRQETRERILAIASELGYRKNHLARGLRSGKSFTVGAVVGYGSAFWDEILAGAQSVFAEKEYHILLDYAPSDARREEMQIEALKAKRVDGFLIAPSDNDPSSGEGLPLPHYHALMEEHIPFVFVDRFAPGLDVDYVAADYFAAARTATRHLIRLGHKKIACIYAPHRMNTGQRELIEGYRSVLREAGMKPMPYEAVKVRADRSEEGIAVAHDLREDPLMEGVTAILTATDALAIGILRVMNDAGVSVPRQMALLSFGGAFPAPYLQPPLSTMTLPLRALGEQAARILLDRIDGEEGPARHNILPAQLIVRASCGASGKG